MQGSIAEDIIEDIAPCGRFSYLLVQATPGKT